MYILYHPCEGYNTFIITEPEGKVIINALYPEWRWYNELIFLFSVLSQTVHVHQM